MGRLWSIEKAAVEQKICFPNKAIYVSYIQKLIQKQEPHEVIATVEHYGGAFTAVIRKRYNYACFLHDNERRINDNHEWTREELVIDREILVDQSGRNIEVLIETYFDTNAKFGVHTDAEEGSWINLYASYNPYADTVHVTYTVCTDEGSNEFPYLPTPGEALLIKDLIIEAIQIEHGMTPQEFCESVFGASEYGEFLTAAERIQTLDYTWDNMIPISRSAALQLFPSVTIYRILPKNLAGADDREEKVYSLQEIEEHASNGGMFGIKKEKT